ncbi:hypothetical protein Dxin01_01961 [Deinococcus xinjiangensis]|uniref:Lipoprotein n=1 Tax=Deinococcus xinjiangensis TaxID=457454 RepID=A0ABP9VDB8_9DEIO
MAEAMKKLILLASLLLSACAPTTQQKQVAQQENAAPSFNVERSYATSCRNLIEEIGARILDSSRPVLPKSASTKDWSPFTGFFSKPINLNGNIIDPKIFSVSTSAPKDADGFSAYFGCREDLTGAAPKTTLSASFGANTLLPPEEQRLLVVQILDLASYTPLK